MKKISFIIAATAVALAGLVLAGAAARAQVYVPGGGNAQDGMSSGRNIAELYYKFSGQTPDFEKWARLSEAYRAAPDFDKMATEMREASAYRQSFGLLTPGEPVFVPYAARLSGYSLSGKGYFVENFDSGLFIPFSFADENFAVVPRDIIEFQWIGAEDAVAKKIDDLRRASATGKDVSLRLTLTPLHADKDAVVTLDGTDYRLLAAEVNNIAILDGSGGILWQSAPRAASPQQSELMQLYR